MSNKVVELISQAISEQNKGFNPDKETDVAHLERLEYEYSWIGNLCYNGNSVSWTYSKAENYKRALLAAWDELTKLGIPCDGNTSVAEAIRKFCVKRD